MNSITDINTPDTHDDDHGFCLGCHSRLLDEIISALIDTHESLERMFEGGQESGYLTPEQMTENLLFSVSYLIEQNEKIRQKIESNTSEEERQMVTEEGEMEFSNTLRTYH
jgi:hypothetical protein